MSLLSWLVIVAVIVRVISGGGTLVGVGYVFRTESAVALAFIAATLIAAGAATLAIARGRPGWWSLSRRGALVALVSSVVLLLADHESALFAIVAAILAWAIASAMASRARRRA